MSYEIEFLDNGIPLIYKKVKGLDTITISLWVEAGSKYEKMEVNGISHFVEHLFFNIHNNKKIKEKIKDLGIIMNATTTKEYTYYYLIVENENYTLALDLLFEMFNREIKLTDIDREKEVILSEYTEQINSQKAIFINFSKTLWGDNGLGQSVIGRKEVIENMSKDKITDFINMYYVNSKIKIICLGSLPYKNLFNKTNKIFSKLYSKRKVALINENKPLISSNVGINVQKVKSNLLYIAFGFESYSFSDQKRIVIDLLSFILSSGNRGILFEKLREDEKLCYSIGINHSSYQESGSFYVWSAIKNDNFKEFVRILGEIFQNLSDKYLTREKINIAKNQLKTNYKFYFQKPFNYIPFIGKYLLSGELFSIKNFYSKINNIEIEDIQIVAKELFDMNQLVMSIIGDIDYEEIEKAINLII